MRLILLFTMGVAYVSSLQAQEKQLTFEEAVSIGLSDNVIMMNTRNDLKAYKTEKSYQISNFTPNLGIQSGFQQTTGPQVDPEKGFVNATTDYFRATIGSEWVLFSGTSRIHSLKSSSYRLEGQEFLIQRIEQEVMNQVALQFLQVLLDQELLTIAEQNLVTQQRTLDEITGFVEAGSRAEVDKYRQEADVKRYELLVIQARNTLDNDKAALAQTLQLDPSEGFIVVKPNWNVDQIRAMSYNLDELYKTALNSRADYKQLLSTEQASLHDHKGTISGYLPYLSGFASFGSTYFNDNDPLTSTDDFPTQLENRRSTSYGVNLTIPIWDRLRTRNNRVSTKVNYENAQNNLVNLEKTIKIEVQTAYNNFRDVKTGYEVSIAQFDAAKLAYETQQESYTVGLATQVELAMANEAYVGAQASMAQTGYRLLFQKILLDYAIGTLSTDGVNN
ncbi:MAG: TolC family protein [Bacteroidota bacterium]